MRLRILAFTLSLAMLPGHAAPAGTDVRPAEEPALTAYLESINASSPSDPVLDPRDPLLKPRLTAPIEIRRFQPSYPRSLRDNRVQGRVLLAGVLERDGTISSIRVITASGSKQLDAVSINAFKLWRYHPALLEGAPIRTLLYAAMSFSLR